MIKSWMIALVLAGLLIKQGHSNFSYYEQVKEQQLAINDNVDTYKDTWLALQPTIEKWNDSFTSTDQVNDMVSLMQAIDVKSSGLEPATDIVMDGGRRDHGSNIGLTRSCILNGGGGYRFENASITDYLKGLQALEQRDDVVLGRIIIDAKQESGTSLPSLTVSTLCVLLREREAV